MVLAQALVAAEQEQELSHTADGSHNIPQIPLHIARQIMTRADFIKSYDHKYTSPVPSPPSRLQKPSTILASTTAYSSSPSNPNHSPCSQQSLHNNLHSQRPRRQRPHATSLPQHLLRGLLRFAPRENTSANRRHRIAWTHEGDRGEGFGGWCEV